MGFVSGGRDRGFRRRASSSRYREHLEEFLISPNDSVAADISRLIDTYYWGNLLPSDPLMRFQDDKGMGGYLNCLWELIFDIAKRVPYNDPLVYTKEQVFVSVMGDNWNGNYSTSSYFTLFERDPDS